ncbi:hypothetical protein [Halorubrum lacusprofundi]|jgi:uncharacterized membrane protein|uniref:Uncharacterized protein n=1 Tax=Halorubrum lacusprofundi (strain ATCC 49239 / DSM 5036 / JCM 8891 / ACAM 34) TaxID=416348 RepID=B9LRJ6_HALLT|nr:hypothetical protein [Halorubrum lacusprofundi]ACM55819.1 hypothetical protein Hlac_0214 [Halorubrum lacusprofundi ATCC 49239]MCG1006688.1 hypothetical protein [Halorubrum lacusprofundi]
MTQSRFRTAFFAAIMALPTVASTEAAGAAPIEEPNLFSLTTLGAVIGAFLIALLIVAAVRHADR